MGDYILPTTYYQNLKIYWMPGPNCRIASKKHGSVVMSHVTKIYRNGWQLQRFFCIRSNNRGFFGGEKSHHGNHWGWLKYWQFKIPMCRFQCSLVAKMTSIPYAQKSRPKGPKNSLFMMFHRETWVFYLKLHEMLIKFECCDLQCQYMTI